MEEKRTIHGITWKDDLYWMESMKGKKWNEFLHSEEKAVEFLVKKSNTTSLIPILKTEIQSASLSSSIPLLQNGDVQISAKGTFHYVWNWPSCPAMSASALCVKGDTIWTVEEIGNGAEYYCLRCRKRDSNRIIWEVKKVGPFVSVIGNRCYSILSKNTLVYWKIVSWDSLTGKDFKVHYEEKDYRYNLELFGSFVKRQAGEKQDIFKISDSGELLLVEGISLESRKYIFDYSSNTFLKFTNEFPIESFSSKYNLYVTKKKGIRTLWKNKKILWKGVGQVLLDPFGGPWVRFIQPGCETLWWNSSSNENPPQPTSIPYYTSHNRNVPYCIIYPKNNQKVKHLIVIGYGAYGIPTPLNTARWEPLLNRGWAICIGLWRGGGDDNSEWEDSGRCTGREEVIEDVKEVINEAQSKLSISRNDTILYGRSAGGLWVGGVIAKYNIAGGCYMEVPYLDVLRTTTNHKLPLTEIETDEFGLPKQRISDFASILKWSPMEQLISLEKTPDCFQILRTGENDSEVFPYESAKWVQRWNSKNKSRNAWLLFKKNQGHFVSGEEGLEQQAFDLSILIFLIANKKS